ncbi:flp pilus-assembly TadE/G-like family protein [Streptosporangium sp. KLBMP 9127]|nr:flp pilus-assembly TadE/G-like family protein [Streptosporangium sp. KLBMP 9127]
MALLMGMAIMITYVGMARVARHRAQSAADLSALAAARQSMSGSEYACGQAKSLAASNGAVLERCSIEGVIAEVRVSVSLTLPGIGARQVVSRARAGPVRSLPPSRGRWLR